MEPLEGGGAKLNTPSFASFPPFNLSSLPFYPPTYFQLFLHSSYFILPSFSAVLSLHLDSYPPNTHTSFTFYIILHPIWGHHSE